MEPITPVCFLVYLFREISTSFGRIAGSRHLAIAEKSSIWPIMTGQKYVLGAGATRVGISVLAVRQKTSFVKPEKMAPKTSFKILQRGLCKFDGDLGYHVSLFV